MLRYLSKTGLLLAAIGLTAGAAFAGDNGSAGNQKAGSADSVPDWSGFYGGINGGLSDANKDLPAFDSGSVTSQDAKETDIGAQAGHNFQTNRIVIGIEGEVDKAVVITKSK